MFGRYALFSPAAELGKRFGAAVEGGHPPSYNVAPHSDVSVVFAGEEGRVIERFSWGFIPDVSSERRPKALVNARAESVATLPAFAEAFAGNRCLMPANGFYEWKTRGQDRQPYYLTVRDEPLFAVAAIASVYRHEDEVLKTVTPLTVCANDAVRGLNERMPAILARADEAAWLSRDADPGRLLSRLAPYPAADMRRHAVTTDASDPRLDEARLIEAVPEPPGMAEPQKSLRDYF